MAKELLKRSEVKEEYTWNLKDMYPSVDAWKEDLKALAGLMEEIASMREGCRFCRKSAFCP